MSGEGIIYLMRHADAVAGEVDAERALSERGRAQVSRVCETLRRAGGFSPAEIWHSPLVRARETAELLASGLGLQAPLKLVPGLEPDDDPAAIAARLSGLAESVALVGHEPHMGVLASLMVRGPGESPVYFPFPKAGVLALVRSGKEWRSEWRVRAP